MSDLDVRNTRVDPNSELSKRYMSQTQKPGSVPTASVAAYNEAAQNYMISIVQNVYVGGPNLNQTGTHYMSGQGNVRSQNSSKRQVRAPKRQNSDSRHLQEAQSKSPFNEPPPKRHGQSLGPKGLHRNSKSKSNLGMSTNQAAINHYLHEIQATGQDSGGQQSRKKKQRKSAQGQRYFYPIYDVPYQQPSHSMKKVGKTVEKFVIGQNQKLNQSMQKPPFKQYVQNMDLNEYAKGRNPNGVKIQQDGQLYSMNGAQFAQLHHQDSAQAFSQLSLVSSPMQSPKSQIEVMIEDSQRKQKRIQNFTPGESFSSPQMPAVVDSSRVFCTSIKAAQVKYPINSEKEKQIMSRNGPINIRQSQVNQTSDKLSSNQHESNANNTLTQKKATKKQSGLSISQVAPENRIFKVRANAVKFSKDAVATNLLDKEQHENNGDPYNFSSQRLADQSFNLLDKNAQIQKAKKDSMRVSLGDKASNDGDEVNIDEPVSDKNNDKSENRQIQSQSSRIRQEFYTNHLAEKNRRVNKMNSGHNSQSSFQALLGSQMPQAGANKDSSGIQRASKGSVYHIVKRNQIANHTQEKVGTHVNSRGHKLSVKGLSTRGSINAGNLIYNSTDTRSFKRIFTGHRGHKALYDQGVLPQIDSIKDRMRNPQRQGSMTNVQQYQVQKTPREEQLLLLSSQPRLQDFHESKKDLQQSKNDGFLAKTQPSIQLSNQKTQIENSGVKSVSGNGSIAVNQEVLQLKQANPGRRNIDQKIIKSNQNQQNLIFNGAQQQPNRDLNQEQRSLIQSRTGSRNKYSNQQNQTKLAMTQPIQQKQINQIQSKENKQLLQSPQPPNKKSIQQPKETNQISKEGIIAVAQANQRTFTSQGLHQGRRGMAEAKYKTQRKQQGITDAELDRKIEQQLLIKQQNQENQKNLNKTQNYHMQKDINEFLTMPTSAPKKEASQNQSPQIQKELKNGRRASKDLDKPQQLQTNQSKSMHQRTVRYNSFKVPSNSNQQAAPKPARAQTGFAPSSETKHQRSTQQKRSQDLEAKIQEEEQNKTQGDLSQKPQQNQASPNKVSEKASGRKVVVKNLIIQNSNLQNCNVYIGGDEDEKGVTVVQKDDEKREQTLTSDLQRIEMSQIDANPIPDKQRPKLSDFKITKLIGEGHQGKVVQAFNRKTGKVFALKIIPQKLIKEQKQIQHIFNEKQMLTKLRKDFRYFPKIYSTFSDKVGPVSSVPNSAGLAPQRPLGSQYGSGGQCLVFQMSLIEGVNLFKFQKHSLCIELGMVKYFAAQALMIVDYMQDQNLIYRDVKPENFMVEFESGNLKLVDFGFAKQLKYEKANGLFQGRGRTYTKCGTPEYMAPEVIQQKELSNTETRVSQSSFLSKQLGYSLECDVWSWGVMLCEMVGGFNPFAGGNVQQTFENILSLSINWPKNISKQCKNLLQSIFVGDPNLRASIQEIKKHPFFHGYQWHDLENSVAPESKEELLRLLSEIKEQNDKEDSKDREEREKLTSKKGLSVQTKNLNNKPYLTEVTEEDKRIDPNELLDSARFTQLVQDYDEISPIDILQPKSAGLPFKMKFLSPNKVQETDSRGNNMSDFSMRKTMLAFKDF